MKSKCHTMKLFGVFKAPFTNNEDQYQFTRKLYNRGMPKKNFTYDVCIRVLFTKKSSIKITLTSLKDPKSVNLSTQKRSEETHDGH